MDKVRVLFLPGVDAGNTNAQSLNVRELALRFDPVRIDSTLWYEHQPDARLHDRAGIRLLKLPSHGKTWRILREMLAGYDLVTYIDYSPASYLFLHLPGVLRRQTKAVLHAEAPAAQLVNPPRTLQFLFEGVYPRCDVYTGITDFVAEDVHRNTGQKVSYILPVGVDTREFAPPARRSNPSPIVLFAGTLMERKGPQYVIDAASQFPNALFRLVGQGRQGFERSLQEKIARLNLRNVKLEGPKTQSEMSEVMRASDIFLLPSRVEGIPKVTLEAAATGLPCIVFRDYATPSVLDGITGFQVRTIDEMMQTLGRLIADRCLREQMGAAARVHVEKFTWDSVSMQWQSAYFQMAGKAQ